MSAYFEYNFEELDNNELPMNYGLTEKVLMQMSGILLS